MKFKYANHHTDCPAINAIYAYEEHSYDAQRYLNSLMAENPTNAQANYESDFFCDHCFSIPKTDNEILANIMRERRQFRRMAYPRYFEMKQKLYNDNQCHPDCQPFAKHVYDDEV